jgi:vanillate O-demethylase monooxygenase subunit
MTATLLDQRLVLWRTGAGISVANDICLHRGIPLSMGWVAGDHLVCKYHGFHYSADGQCVKIPANPEANIPKKLCLKTYPAQEAYSLVGTTLSSGSTYPLPGLPEWNDSDYQQILPEAVDLDAAAGRQMEGFLDVAHFAWVHTETFGDINNPVVPRYEVMPTEQGLRAKYSYSHMV